MGMCLVPAKTGEPSGRSLLKKQSTEEIYGIGLAEFVEVPHWESAGCVGGLREIVLFWRG